MDVVIAGSTVTRKYTDDELARISIELSADATEIGVGSMVIDDEAGTDNVAGGRQLKTSEGVTVLSDGFIGDQDRDRGSQKAGSHLEHVYSVQDANVLVYGRRHVGRSRGSETDRARVLYFASQDFPSADTTWVLNTHTATMAAKKYTGVGWGELMSDTFDLTGKVLFVHDKANGTGRCLHYHLETEGHTSGLTISDDPDAMDGVTIFAPQNPSRARGAPSQQGELQNNVYARDQANRHTTVTDSTSILTYDADGLKHQAIVDFEASSQADLNAKAAAYLAESKNEAFVYRCTIGPLDQDALGLVRVGDRIVVTSHVLGLSSQTVRIAHMTLTITKDVAGHAKPGWWDATLELEKPLRYRGRARTGQKPVTQNQLGQLLGTIATPYCVMGNQKETFSRSEASDLGESEFDGHPDWTIISAGVSQEVTVGTAILTAGNDFDDASSALALPFESGPIEILLKFDLDSVGDGASAVFLLGTANFEAATGRILVLTITANDTFYGLRCLMNAPSGGGAEALVDVTAPKGTTLWVRFLMEDRTVSMGASTSGPPVTYDAVETYSGAFDVRLVPTMMELFAGGATASPGEDGPAVFTMDYIEVIQGLPQVCRVLPTFTAGPPAPGQPVSELIGDGDGTTTVFTTDFPFAEGSLRVYVDGVDQTAAIATTDAAAGEFALSFAPLAASGSIPAEVIRVYYQAA